MRKLLLDVIVLASTVVGPITEAQESERTGRMEPSVFSCIRGKCQDMTKSGL